ncbi:hypothetical protein SOVF_069920 [Spinacia oleracea]|nr:hypothetical protein SOVF_069920 [Spinacia oleracea]
MAFHTQPYRSDYYTTHGHICNLNDVVPRYPSLYDNDIGSGYEDEDGVIHIEHHHHPQHHVPEVVQAARHHGHHPRARFVDFVEPNNGERKAVKFANRDNEEKLGVIRSVDDAADGFIKAKHRGFGLRHWKTFRM